MSRRNRTLLRVVVPEENTAETADLIESLMGRKPELRFKFIQENASFVGEVDI